MEKDVDLLAFLYWIGYGVLYAGNGVLSSHHVILIARAYPFVNDYHVACHSLLHVHSARPIKEICNTPHPITILQHVLLSSSPSPLYSRRSRKYRRTACSTSFDGTHEEHSHPWSESHTCMCSSYYHSPPCSSAFPRLCAFIPHAFKGAP